MKEILNENKSPAVYWASKKVNRMKNFFEDVGEFFADNWVTIVLSAATTIVIRLLLSL